MSSQTVTPQKQNRRSRRQQQKKSAGSISSQIPSSQDAELSTDTNPEKQLEQPTRILRRGDLENLPSPTPAVNLELPPHTPPRPRSMYEGSTVKQHTSNELVLDMSQNRKQNSKAPGRKQSGSASPMPASNNTFASAPRNQSLTPTRGNETPVKAYAGPTFHASPAASSLPMPKFFSKSMPNVDKTSSLKSMMEQEAPETASESEGSPFQENTQPVRNHRTREASPLDIFFRADEKAKAKARPLQESAVKSFDGQSILSASPFGLQTPSRHHSRHPTDGSVGGMFPLEMDGIPPDMASNSTHSGNGSLRYEPAIHNSSSMAEPDLTEEQRRAKTAALKQLLYSNRTPLPQNSSAGQRPPSSSLRQELTMPSSPGAHNSPPVPSTPTPSRVQNPHMCSRTQHHPNGYVSPYSQFPAPRAQSQGSNTMPKSDNGNKKSLEDDLRRILKLEIMGGDGVPRVRSSGALPHEPS